jgi:hypothetical protein
VCFFADVAASGALQSLMNRAELPNKGSDRHYSARLGIASAHVGHWLSLLPGQDKEPAAQSNP